MQHDYNAYRLGYRVFAARHYRWERNQVGRRQMRDDMEAVQDYLSKSESDHDRAALIFALIAAAMPFAIVAVLVSAWALFFA